MRRFVMVVWCGIQALPVMAGTGPAIDAMQEYPDFAEYADGSISTEQLASTDTGEVLFVNTRNRGQYQAGHIPGAANIEWREILFCAEDMAAGLSGYTRAGRIQVFAGFHPVGYRSEFALS